MTRSYRSVQHHAGNTTSTTKSFPGERRVSTRASRVNVESSNPRFSLKASVYALLLAMGGVGYLNVASAAAITVQKGNGGTSVANCVANDGSADATGKLDWSCIVKGEAGSVGMLSERGDRDGPSISLLPARLKEDSVAIGRNSAVTEGRAGIAIGADSKVSSLQGIAIGENAKASIQLQAYAEDRRLGLDPFVGGGIAIGANATAISHGDVVIGDDAARYTGRKLGPGSVGYGSSVIVGAGAGTGTSSADDAFFGAAVFVGARAGSSIDGSRNIAVGYGAAHRLKGASNLAIGYYAFGKESENERAEVNDSIGLGTEVGLSSRGARNILVGKSTGQLLNGSDNIVMGMDSGKGIVGSNNVILGKSATGPDDAANRSSEKIDSAVSIGSKSKVRGSNSLAIGPSSLADKAGVAIGSEATATTAGGVAIGKGAVEGAANPFASATIRGTAYQYAGIAPVSVVSVGNVNTERQITNVAAGRISATSTDAINGSQLYAVHQAIENLNIPTAGSSWNLQVNGDTSTVVEPDSTVSLNAGSNIQLAHEGNAVTISTTPNITVESVQANAVTANSISAKDALRITDGPALTRDGIDAADKTISNVAAGTISATSTDAINGSQLYAVRQALDDLTVSTANAGRWNLQVNGDTPTVIDSSSTVGLNAGSNIQLERDGNNVSISTAPNIKVESVQANAVTADNVTAEAVTAASVTAGSILANETLGVTDGPSLTKDGVDAANKKIVNVADGEQDHDAVNVAQLNRSAQDLNDRIDGISNGLNDRLGQAESGVNDRVAQVTSGLSDRIAKVESGLNSRIDRVAADADAGSATAGAIANLPQAILPGENAFAIATAGYRGQQGYAAGLSRVSENGHWVVKGSLSGNNRGHMMYGAGIAYKW